MAMTHRPYSCKGIEIRFKVNNNGEKHLVTADILKALRSKKRPEDIAKILSPGSCYKAKVEFPGMHPQIMWVITPAGLQEIIEKKFNPEKIRGFRSWLRERKLLPSESVASNVTMAEDIKEDRSAIVNTIYGYIDESTDYRECYEKLLSWLKECPILNNKEVL
jgi:prophage antirepressor-like protein